MKRRTLPSSGLISNQNTIQRKGFIRIEKARKDIEQTVFYIDASKQAVDFQGNPHRYAQFTEKGVDPYHMTTCPFCWATQGYALSCRAQRKASTAKPASAPSAAKAPTSTPSSKWKRGPPKSTPNSFLTTAAADSGKKSILVSGKTASKLWVGPKYFGMLEQLRGDSRIPTRKGTGRKMERLRRGKTT